MGPVLIETPDGAVSGYVVLTQGSSPLGMMSMERHFVAGIGMVRQVFVMSSDEKRRVRRDETVLGPLPGQAVAGVRPGHSPTRSHSEE